MRLASPIVLSPSPGSSQESRRWWRDERKTSGGRMSFLPEIRCYVECLFRLTLDRELKSRYQVIFVRLKSLHGAPTWSKQVRLRFSVCTEYKIGKRTDFPEKWDSFGTFQHWYGWYCISCLFSMMGCGLCCTENCFAAAVSSKEYYLLLFFFCCHYLFSILYEGNK